MKNVKTIKKIFISFLCLLASFTLLGVVFALSNYSQKIAGIPANQGPRIKYNFNYDWKFAKGEGKINSGSDLEANPIETYSCVTNSSNPFANNYTMDNCWSDISLAHTFNDTDTFNNFTESGMNGERSTYTGSSWYKKEFFVPLEYTDKKIYIEFEAARQVAEVYINGTKVTAGTYKNGFIPFGYDLTDYLNFGATNYITVMVDNSFPYYLSGSNVIPWHDSHWHPNFGGLYRNSYLYVVDNLHLTLPLYSFLESEGTYIYTSNENGTNKTADINVDAQVENSTDNAQTFKVRSIVYNANDVEVLRFESASTTLDAGEKAHVLLSGTLTNAIRWSTKYPYLYNVVTQIIQDDTVIDNNSIDIGIRTYRFTNNYGFYLNENYLELNGWGQKTTMEYAGLGAAYPDWMTDMVIKLMKDGGGNYIRWGHVAGSPSQIDAANKYGLLVTQPGVDGEGTYESSYSTASIKLRAEAFRDMLIYYRNNPSIIMWEIGNQSSSMNSVLSGTNLSDVSGTTDFGSTSANLAELLYFFAGKYDYGNRTGAANGTIANAGSYDSTISTSDRALTIRSATTATANYVEVTETTNAQSGGIIAGKPAVEGEYNRYEARRGVWDIYTNNFTAQSDHHFTSEDYAVRMVERKTKTLSVTSNMGGANWIFSDSTSHGRVNTEVARVSGEVDATMLPKEGYFANKVLFNATDATYIIGHWNYTPGTVKTVYVVAPRTFANVKLYVNSTEYTGTVSNGYLWTFNNVAYVANSTVTAIGYDSSNNAIPGSSSSKTSHGAPVSLKLTMVNNPEGIKANGSDIVLVDVEVIDAEGKRCSTYDGETLNDLITFNLTGDTTKFIWRGGYNSGRENSTNVNTLYAEAGIIRVAIRTTMQSGTVSLNATSAQGLEAINPLTITSNSLANSDTITGFTGVSSWIDSTTYNLTDLTDPDYGNGEILGIPAENTDITSTILIKNFAYTGSDNANNVIADAFGIGSKMYSDEAVTFTNIPYKYFNAEYLLLPNGDTSTLAVDFISFTSKRNIDVYILRDPAITTDPSWLSSYVKTNDKIIGGNGIAYDVYKLTVNKDTLITIGSNVDSVTDLNGAVNQIVMFKETSKVNNLTAFNETFDDFDDDSIKNGFNRFTDTNTSVTLDTTLNGNTLHIVDNSDSETSMAFIQKSFANLEKFKVRYKIYVQSGNSDFNHWLRIWLSDGKVSRTNNVDVRNGLGIETYMDNNTSGVFLGLRPVTAGSTINQIFSSLTLDTWHQFEYSVDTIQQKVIFSLLDEGNTQTTVAYNFSELTTNQINNIIFGTCVWGKSGYYLDDIEIIPIINKVIENVRINENALATFADDITQYLVEGIDASSVLTYDPTIYYKTSTIEYNSTEQAIELNVTDINDNVWTYVFSNTTNSDLYAGWTVHESTGAVVNLEQVGGEDSLNLYDTSGTDMPYLTREINPQTSMYKISFDYYMKTDAIVSSWNRIWLTEGNFLGNSVKTNLGVETYIDEYKQSRIEKTSIIVRYGTSASSSLNSKDSSPAKIFANDTWHNYAIVVDTVNKKYSVYVDDEIVFENIDYFNSGVDIDHITIGTWFSNSGTINLKNYQFENIYSSPVSGIKYNGENVTNFHPTTYSYTIYSDSRLTDVTPIEVTCTNELVPTITYDVVAQTVTILATDLSGSEYEYVINVFPADEQPSTIEALRELINVIDTTYTESNYSTRTWADLMQQVDIGRLLDENSESELISHAYYHINRALEKLVTINLTSEKSSYINIVKISSDILENYYFGQILENGAQAYKNISTVLFRSVPKKYMNANYFIFNRNMNSLGGEIRLTAKRNISVLLFKDREAGEIVYENQTGECTNVNNCFIDTGDIVTVIDGTSTIVYKVYRRDYTVNSEILIDARYLITNRINQNTNILAIKGTDEVDANAFLIDNTAKYLTLEDYQNTWKNYVYDTKGSTENYNQFLETKDGQTAIRMESNAGNDTINSSGVIASARSFFETTRQFAKLSGKFTVSYFASIENISAEYDNKYLRTAWITNGSATDWEIGTSDVKTHVLNETYFSNADLPTGKKNIYSLVYRYSTVTGSNGSKHNYLATAPTGTWLAQVKYELDVRNNKYNVSYDNAVVGTDLPFLPQNPHYTYADHIMFGTRATGLSRYWFRDVEIEPIEDDLISNITVNNNTVSNVDNEGYNSITKDYLYRATDLTTKNVAITNGSNYGTSTINTNTDYDEINLTSSASYGSITLNHRVYYEVTCSRAKITSLIEKASNLYEIDYTIGSFTNMITAKNTAISLLNDQEISCQTINDAAADLEEAINSLVSKYTFYVQYAGSIAPGNDLETSSSSDINITNNSSVTLRANFDKAVGNTYNYATVQHTRKLISSAILPAGTFITMIDDSLATPKYYYYEVTATDVTNNKSEYLFSDFKVMSGAENYTDLVYYDNVSGLVSENFIFIVDFDNATDKLNDGVYTLKIECSISGEVIDMTPASYNIHSNFGTSLLSISASEQSYYNTDIIELSFNAKKTIGSINSKPIYETKLFNTNLGIIFQLYDNNNVRINLPTNTKISFGDNFCYVNNNECRLMLGPITTEITGNITVSFGLNALPASNYNLKATLLSSIDGELNGASYVTSDNYLRILEKPSAAFKINLVSYNVIRFGNAYTLSYLVEDNVENSYVVASLKRKNGSNFDDLDLNIYTSENLIEYATNMYNLGDISTWEATLIDTAAKGTYMLVFDLYDSNATKVSTIRKYFIIK